MDSFHTFTRLLQKISPTVSISVSFLCYECMLHCFFWFQTHLHGVNVLFVTTVLHLVKPVPD